MYLGTKGKLKIVGRDKLDNTALKIAETWVRNNYLVMTWLRKYMETFVLANFMFSYSAKDHWDENCATCYMKKNAS